MYKIGLFSELMKVTIKTLRYYDEIGILKPSFIDKENGYRYYDTNEAFILNKIMLYRQCGLSIKDIKEIILNKKDENLILENKQKELVKDKENINQSIVQISYLLNERNEKLMDYKVVIKELPECIVYCKELKLKKREDYFSLIPAIGEEVLKVNPNLKCLEPDYNFTCYLDGEYKEEDIHLAYCQAVNEMGIETDSIKFKKLEKTKAACLLYKGTYQNMREAYTYLVNFLKENGYEIASYPRESYIDGIWNKEDENEWLTEIEIPIK
jgi:DNA-binding transcriptional MerR regulator